MLAHELYTTERKILYKEIESISGDLCAVPYAVIKGEALSQQIYGVTDRRRSGDIDILIDKSNVKALEEFLQKNGFRQQVPQRSGGERLHRILCMAYSHQIPSYHKDKLGFHLNVDVNYDIFWGEYEGQRCSMAEFLCDTEETYIYGVRVKTLSLEKAFLQLILHHYKEMNSLYHLHHYNCIRTDLFRDIHDMLILRKECLTVKTVVALAHKYAIGGIMYYMLFYTDRVFPGELDAYLLALEDKREEAIMDSFGLCSKERKVWRIPFEKRLDNDEIWSHVKDELTEADLRKVERNAYVFT
ncbi:MAG: nucleotidyltransferase family protein [Clostridia bacterium]|nr:nucleotidyltransferase family protein [Clostridia bacterium]